MDADLGGTEMPAALRQAFALGGSESAADVLLITDGEIWNAEGLVAEARAARQRVFVVGIGSAPAEGVLKRLAEASGGACEFVAPNEDAEGAILRMFARLRAPRVERAEIAWPVTPEWTTPMPGGLFGGETIHAFAGFAAAPSGDVALKLIARGDAQSLTASAPLPATVVEDRTLARVAAARRIVTASEAEQLKLALDYGLLTAHTNLLVVHERAESERAQDLPELAKVAQMHAAGWHGVGSVRELRVGVVSACMFDASASVSFDKLDQPAVTRRRSAAPKRLTDDDMSDWTVPAFLRKEATTEERRVPTAVERFLVAVERAGLSRLPATLYELARMGLPEALVDELRAFVTAGNAEADVVRALYEALAGLVADSTVNAPVSRQFVRTLRRQFGRPDECRELREKVKMASVTALAASVA
jgi:Ca-activated chloride channel family protein